MHPVLDLKADRSDAQNHKSLKQRLRQAGLCSFLTHHDWTELTVIAYKYQLKNETGYGYAKL